MEEDRMSKELDDARCRLRTASWNLARWRRIGIFSNRDERKLREAEQELFAALDHSAVVEARNGH
jgi:hypothetical protein